MGNIDQIYPAGHKDRLGEDAPLWRYIPLKTLFLYLSGNIFIPSIAKLQHGDPFEGKFPFDSGDFESALKSTCGQQFGVVQNWIRSALWNQEQKQFMQTNKDWSILAKGYDMDCCFRFLSETRYAWCWFQGSESAAMWQTYGKEGVAIKGTVQSLSAALKPTTYDFIFGKMCYYDHRYRGLTDAESHMFSLRPHFLKRKEYASENEVRFVTCAPQREGGGLLLNNINPETWTSEIRLWPGLTSREEDSIKRAVAAELPTVHCSKSDLLQTHGKAMLQAFEDLSAQVAAKDEQKWKSGQDEVPKLLKHL